MILALVAVPGIFGLVSLLTKRQPIQLGLLVAGAACHAALTALLWRARDARWPGALLGLDAAGLLFLSMVSALFLVASLYSISYLSGDTHDKAATPHLYVPLLLFFLAAMTLVTVSQHLALMWVAIEATTLTSAPLIYYYRRGPALEAAWKYLLICSVGIALALLGTFFLAVAGQDLPSGNPGLSLPALLPHAAELSRPWLHMAFVLVLVGYGTKMGLVPLHTWLPDAHSQAPSPVSALLSGSLLNCAFLGILRFYQICVAGGDGVFAQRLLLTLGFASLAVAATFIVGQKDYKRLFAYSSVENMGVLAIGVGLGGSATYGAMLHAVNHSLGKGALFMLAGNVLRAFGTTEARAVRGVLQRLPLTGVGLVAALFAIAGSPPFGLFVSEFTIFQAAMSGRQSWLGVLFVAILAVAFIGLCATVLPMAQGRITSNAGKVVREVPIHVAPPLILVTGVLLLGLYVPPFLDQLLAQVASLLGGE